MIGNTAEPALEKFPPLQELRICTTIDIENQFP